MFDPWVLMCYMSQMDFLYKVAINNIDFKID
jgi:hypothetical protein